MKKTKKGANHAQKNALFRWGRYVHISQEEIDRAKKEYFDNGGTITVLNQIKRGDCDAKRSGLMSPADEFLTEI